MLKQLNIADIKVRKRHRKGMGDLTSLADSIRQEGLLQPIGVTEKLELVFGYGQHVQHEQMLEWRMARSHAKSLFRHEFLE